MKKRPPSLKIVIWGRDRYDWLWMSVNDILFYAPYVTRRISDYKVNGLGWRQSNAIMVKTTESLTIIDANLRQLISKNAWQLLSPLSRRPGNVIIMRFKSDEK